MPASQRLGLWVHLRGRHGDDHLAMGCGNVDHHLPRLLPPLVRLALPRRGQGQAKGLPGRYPLSVQVARQPRLVEGLFLAD